jgi:hypothetical protein
LSRIAWDGHQRSLRIMRVMLSELPLRRCGRRGARTQSRAATSGDDRHRREHSRARPPRRRSPAAGRNWPARASPTVIPVRPDHDQHQEGDGSELAGAYRYGIWATRRGRGLRAGERTIRARKSIKLVPMTGISATQTSQNRAVRAWLLVVAGLIAIMVLVGGCDPESVCRSWNGSRSPARCRRCRRRSGRRPSKATGYPAVSRLNAGMSLSVQDHLLVGMEPPPARARDRRRHLLPFCSSCGAAA